MSATPQRAVQRITLSVDEAAASLGISRDSLEREVLWQLRTVRVGRRRLVPVTELARWVDAHATRALDDLERRV